MPAVSKKQQIAMAIAEHSPSKLNPANKGMLNMSHQQQHDFASTPRTGLPNSAKPKGPDANYYQAHGLLSAAPSHSVPETKSKFRYKASGER